MVTLANEDLVEADETFVIRCTVLTGAGTFVNGMTSDDATVTIENDDGKSRHTVNLALQWNLEMWPP